MAMKVLVTPRSFGKHSAAPIELLRASGLTVVFNPHGRILEREEMRALIRDADAVIVGVDPLDRDVLAEAGNLKLIAKYGVGTDNIDMEYAASRGIAVTTTAGANTEAVADYTFALLLAAARKMVPIDRACRQSDWKKITTVDVYGRTLGLVGLGNIGKAVVRRAAGFKMNVIAYDAQQDTDFAAEHGVKYTASLDELLREADFITLHVPLLPSTRHMIGEREFALMKETAVLVNTARGGLIDERALLDAMRQGRIWGAGVDVFEQEPPENKGLLSLDNIVIGSHCAASTVQAIDNMGLMASERVIHYLCEGGSR
ncbi:D-3-phosphoglycerate dehydrogenase [Paenibacillus phyllosphaerae]|uniref:D-3-phosphoglycerate dehydrogenase n=1 Tax=Paenibacillus phyllosphaerae TaxID=274593 RepID=A0A7W5FNC7_9BACL|nr:phosphoglycerate dehydrogenase [Paenibacillus phyllosphaerae]MBB3111043.1 D-3-phosphoglycerate dehydrogenase [Paenibacillus phyllosphaerae]